MDKISASKYKKEVEKAVALFWDTKMNQTKNRKKEDQGQEAPLQEESI